MTNTQRLLKLIAELRAAQFWPVANEIEGYLVFEDEPAMEKLVNILAAFGNAETP